MTRATALMVSLALAAGCTTIPRATNELEAARAAYRAAAANPQVQARAPVELEIAERALGDAERLHQADAEPARVAHFAYVAERRARIAVETAEMRAAEAAVATASAERSRMQLEQSARERAERQAQLAAQQAAAAKEMAEQRGTNLAGAVTRLQAEMRELEARETGRGWVLTLRDEVLFDSASAALKPGSERALEALAALMQNSPERPIAIEGFTDATGSPEANRRLSEARAVAVKQALVQRGVDAARIQTRGQGPAFPIASNETEIGRQLNRRVEIVIAPQPT